MSQQIGAGAGGGGQMLLKGLQASGYKGLSRADRTQRTARGHAPARGRKSDLCVLLLPPQNAHYARRRVCP